MQKLGLGAPQQMDEHDDERIEMDDPRGQDEVAQHLVAKPTQQSEDQVQVEDITSKKNSDIEEDEE
jgi:hypothetical protein